MPGRLCCISGIFENGLSSDCLLDHLDHLDHLDLLDLLDLRDLRDLLIL